MNPKSRKAPRVEAQNKNIIDLLKRIKHTMFQSSKENDRDERKLG